MASFSEKQDSTLGQFKHALKGDQQEKRNEYIQKARERKAAFDEKQKLIEKDDTQFVGGFNNTVINEIERKRADKRKRYLDKIEQLHNDPNLHPMQKAAIDIFGPKAKFDAEIVKEYVGQTHQLIDQDNIKVKVKFNRALKGALKFTIYAEYEKEYFRKGENFAETKEVVKDVKTISEEITGKAKYGDYFDFRGTLLRPFGQLIKTLGLQKTEDEKNENIWEFSFSK